LFKGDVAYIPQGYGHSIENTGSKAGRVLIGLNTGNYQAIDLSQWVASTPPYLLADHFGQSSNSQASGVMATHVRRSYASSGHFMIFLMRLWKRTTTR